MFSYNFTIKFYSDYRLWCLKPLSENSWQMYSAVRFKTRLLKQVICRKILQPRYFEIILLGATLTLPPFRLKLKIR